MFAQAQAQAAVSGKTAAAASLVNGRKDEKNGKPEGEKGVNEEEKKEKLAANGNAIPEKIKDTDKIEEKKDANPIEKDEDQEKSQDENPWGEDKEEKKGSNPWADDISDEGEKKMRIRLNSPKMSSLSDTLFTSRASPLPLLKRN